MMCHWTAFGNTTRLAVLGCTWKHGRGESRRSDNGFSDGFLESDV